MLKEAESAIFIKVYLSINTNKCDAFMSGSIFLSHNSRDEKFAKKLHLDLTNQGITVWMYQTEVNPGDSIIGKVENAIKNSDYLGILLSPNSSKSVWVSEEYGMAMHLQIKGKGPRVIPILIEDCEIPGFLEDKSRIDFRNENYYQENLDKLLRVLQNKDENKEYITKPLPNQSLSDRIKSQIEVVVKNYEEGFMQGYMSSADLWGEKGELFKLVRFLQNNSDNIGLSFQDKDIINNLLIIVPRNIKYIKDRPFSFDRLSELDHEISQIYNKFFNITCVRLLSK
jgi:hypothetical protein